MTRPAGEEGIPVIGVVYGYFSSRSAETVDFEKEGVVGENPPDGAGTS